MTTDQTGQTGETSQSGQTDFDPAAVLVEITAATEHLLRTAARLTDAEVRVPRCSRAGRASTC